MAALTGPDPYDAWRLAAGCSKALRASGGVASRAGHIKRFYAHCNLLLADHARGAVMAPRSFVRSTLAILWRDYALFGAAAEDVDQVTLLDDYGLTVDWRVTGTSAFEARWRAKAEPQAATAGPARELGVLRINAAAYDEFLRTADGAISALSQYGSAANDNDCPANDDTAAADVAFRLGAAACALGLGQVASLADALGLAWRRRTHASAVSVVANSRAIVGVPDVASMTRATGALSAMLLRVAPGVAPLDSLQALTALTQVIEHGRQGHSHRCARHNVCRCHNRWLSVCAAACEALSKPLRAGRW